MDLFNKLKNKYDYIHIEFSDYSQKELNKKIKEFQDTIRKENMTIPNINDQIILTNPYYFDKIIGCLHNYAAEINGHILKDIKYTIAMFVTYDDSVLNR